MDFWRRRNKRGTSDFYMWHRNTVLSSCCSRKDVSRAVWTFSGVNAIQNNIVRCLFRKWIPISLVRRSQHKAAVARGHACNCSLKKANSPFQDSVAWLNEILLFTHTHTHKSAHEDWATRGRETKTCKYYEREEWQKEGNLKWWVNKMTAKLNSVGI